jgi:polyisoprenoid-binding protein YceI
VSRPVKLIVAGAVAVVALVTIGTFVYINFVEDKAPTPLALTPSGTGAGSGTTATTGAPVSSSSLSGTWRPTTDSVVGYRVKENLFGQANTAYGRTSTVNGTLTLDGTTVTAADLSVDMTTVKSDQDRRDNQFRGRIMDTAAYPTATFKLGQPIKLDTLPTEATPVTVKATGQLTLRGTTKPVTIDLKAQRKGANIEVNGTVPITFAEWNIPSPSFGPVSTEDHGVLELLVVFAKAA